MSKKAPEWIKREFIEAKHFDELPREVQEIIKEALSEGNFEFILDEESKMELKEKGVTEQDILAAMLKDAKLIN